MVFVVGEVFILTYWKVGEGWGMGDGRSLYLCSRKLGSERWLISESFLTCCVFLGGGIELIEWIEGIEGGDRVGGDGFDGGE